METKETKKKTEGSSSQKLVKTVRRGAIAANIWKRQGPNGYVYYDYSLSRSWKSTASGREGYSSNFFAENEEALLAVIKEASAEMRELLVSTEPLAANAA